MPTILWLAMAAAVYPQLLAIVVVILTRPDPKRLLWACYLGALCTNIVLSLAVLLVFRARGTVAGSTSHRLGGSVFFVAGAIALLIAILMLTEGGRRRLASLRGRARRGRAGGRDRGLRERLRAGRGPVERQHAGPGFVERQHAGPGFVERQRAHARGALARGSLVVALAVGIALGIPGPFDMLALGRLARGGYALLTATLAIIAFSLVKFALIEVPIAGYVLNPEGTTARVQRLSLWMKAHHTTMVAVLAAGVGIFLISQGVSRIG